MWAGLRAKLQKEPAVSILKEASLILKCAWLGAILYLSVMAAFSVMEHTVEDQFVSWVGANFHRKLQSPGNKLGASRYGAEGWAELTMNRPDRQAYYVIAVGGVIGLTIGVLVGAVLVAGRVRRRRSGEDSSAKPNTEAAQGLTVPALWPLGLALAGFLFHGYVLGPMAIVLAGHSRAGRWRVWATAVVATGVVLFWSAGTEVWFGEGWSKTYPWAKFLYHFRGE